MYFSKAKCSSNEKEPQANHFKTHLIQPNIDIQIMSNILNIISNLGPSKVSEKQISLKLLDLIQQICKNYLSNHYLSTPEAIDKLGIKVYPSTIQVNIPPSCNDIKSFI